MSNPFTGSCAWRLSALTMWNAVWRISTALLLGLFICRKRASQPNLSLQHWVCRHGGHSFSDIYPKNSDTLAFSGLWHVSPTDFSFCWMLELLPQDISLPPVFLICYTVVWYNFQWIQWVLKEWESEPRWVERESEEQNSVRFSLWHSAQLKQAEEYNHSGPQASP